MTPPRVFREYIEDILTAAGDAIRFVEGMSL